MTTPNQPHKPIMKPARGLGKGVDALFLSEPNFSSKAPLNTDTINIKDGGVLTLSVTTIIPGRYQPRKSFDNESALELTESIRQHGVLQPIIVRHIPEKQQYEIVAGERRWRAAKAANLTTIPALVRTISDQQMILFGLIENLQRENLNCLEEAEGISRIVNEYHITHEKTAELLSKSRSSITNLLRLLDLSNPVKDYLREGKLEMGHARALISLPPEIQKKIADIAVTHKLSVRDVEKRANLKSGASSKPSNVSVKSQIIDYETQLCVSNLEEIFGLPIDINVDKLGAGILSFRFSKKEQQLDLLNRLTTLGYAPSSTT